MKIMTRLLGAVFLILALCCANGMAYSFCSGEGCSAKSTKWTGSQSAKDSALAGASITQAGGSGNSANIEINNFYGAGPYSGTTKPTTGAPTSDDKEHRELTHQHAIDSMVMGLEAAKTQGLLNCNYQVFLDTDDFGQMAEFYDEVYLDETINAAIASGATTPETVRMYMVGQGWQVVGLVGTTLGNVQYLMVLDASAEKGPGGLPDHANANLIKIDWDGSWQIIYQKQIWYDGTGAPMQFRANRYVGEVR